MNRFRQFATRVDRFLDEFDAVRQCGSAYRAGRRPPESALRTLGFGATAFGRNG